MSRVPLLLRALLFGSIVVGAGAPAAHAQTPSPPAAAEDRREIDARTAFARGDYREALSLYVKLYAETLHPTYLRNVGRCYQNLGEADKAISSFRDYLRKAKDLPPEKRQEIEGYIAEMEALKRQQAAGTAAAPAPAPSATQPPAHTEPPGGGVLPPALSPSDSGGPAGSPGLQVETQAAPEPAPPLHRRWYFWAAIGTGLVVAAVAVAVAASGSAGPPRGGLGTVDLRMGGTAQ